MDFSLLAETYREAVVLVNQKTLDKLIKILRDNEVVCGIGGSYLLQIYQLYSEPDDVDFWVAPDDIKKVKHLFAQYEEIEEKIQLPPEYHFKMRYYDIDVDFVACFMVKPNKNEYVYNIMPENIEMIDMGGGKYMPCTSLEDWYIVYKLLKRDEKAELIKDFLCKHKNESLAYQKLQMSLENVGNKLPQKLTKDVKNFLWENSQINIFDLYDV